MDIYLAIDGQQTGPFTEETVRQKLASGEITGDSLMWKDGMVGWEAVSQHLPPTPASSPSGTPPPAPAKAAPASRSLASVESLLPPAETSRDWVLAERPDRLKAALLDCVFALVCCAPALLALAVTGVFSDNGSFPVLAFLLYLLGGLLIAVVQLYLLATRSQTLGKMLLRLRIYNFETRAPADWVKTIILRGLVNGLIAGAIPFIGGLYAIADICFIFRDDRRCIHDLIAGTVVGKY